MKVGTDGVLLGLLASVPIEQARVLDIGTGTGLVSLLLAQRFPQAVFDAFDIDEDAVAQARENFAASPFASRLRAFVADSSVYQSAYKYDLVVINPPFFVDATHCPDHRRTLARHNVAFSFPRTISNVANMLTPSGLFTVIIPADLLPKFSSLCLSEHLHLSRLTQIFPNRRKPVRRVVATFSFARVDNPVVSQLVLEESPRVNTQEFSQLTHDFYLDK